MPSNRLPAAGSVHVLSMLRIVSAFLLMAQGTLKLFAFPAPSPMGHIELMSRFGMAGLLETFGGALLLIGLFTRPVAFILSGEMAVAYFLAHAPQGFWPILNRVELAVLNCFTFLHIAAAGGGPWSVDRFRK